MIYLFEKCRKKILTISWRTGLRPIQRKRRRSGFKITASRSSRDGWVTRPISIWSKISGRRWSIFDKREEQPQSKDWKKIAQTVWKQVSAVYLLELYESMPQRMEAVIAAGGSHTKYWWKKINQFVWILWIDEFSPQVNVDLCPR